MIFFETQEESWNWLMSNLSKREMSALYHEAYNILKNKDDATDALHEALLRGATYSHQLRNEARVFQWMFTITRNVAYRMYNKNHKLSLSIRTKLHFQRSNWAESAEAHHMNAYQIQQLRDEIRNLKYPGKEILVMHIFQGIGFKEIAKKLQLNYNSVRSIYHRTLMLMKEKLEDQEHV